MRIAILGGTGRQGSGLALRWARAGHQVIIGSRSADKALQVAAELTGRLGGDAAISGSDNDAAAAAGEVVVLSVPYHSQDSILASVIGSLAGKPLITVVVPLKPPKVSQVWRPAAGSAAQQAQMLLGEATPVVAALQNISAELLADPNRAVDSDVLICGDSQVAKEVASRLVADAGLRPVDAGPLVNASVVEGLTAVLIGINARHRVKGAGIRITGLGARPADLPRS